jgi:hypothetical protein
MSNNKLGVEIWREWKVCNDKDNFSLQKYTNEELSNIITNIDNRKEFFYLRLLENTDGVSFYGWLKLKIRENKLKLLGI